MNKIKNLWLVSICKEWGAGLLPCENCDAKAGWDCCLYCMIEFYCQTEHPPYLPFFASFCSFCRNWHCSNFIHYEIQLLLTSECITFSLNRLFIMMFFPELCWICSCLLDLLVQCEASASRNTSAWLEPLGTGWKVNFPSLLGAPGLCTNSQQNHLGNHGHLPGLLLCSDERACALAGVLSESHTTRCACSDPWMVQMSWN